MVGLGRVELPTSPLSGVRSSQLSYRPGQRAGPSKLDGSVVTLGTDGPTPPHTIAEASKLRITHRVGTRRGIDLVAATPHGMATP
jgi:hypothetical protein